MGGAAVRATDLLLQQPGCNCSRTDCEHYAAQVAVAQVHALLEISTWLERIDDALRNTVGGR